MRVYDWKSNDTRDIIISHPFENSWSFYAETKSASEYFNQLSGRSFKWAFVHCPDYGVLTTDNKHCFDMLFKIIKGTNFVVDLHLGESE